MPRPTSYYGEGQLPSAGAPIVAAIDSPLLWREAATVVCTGNNDGAIINSALQSYGEVKLAPGNFWLQLNVHPRSAAYYAGLIIPDGCKVDGVRGKSVLTLPPNTAGDAVGQGATFACIYNDQIAAGGDQNIVLSNFIIDGNNVNQSAPAIHHGISMQRARGALIDGVTVRNLRGSGSSGPTENFFFETVLGSDTTFRNCKALTSAGSSSTGFSADQATGAIWEACIAYGMSVTHGFTHNSCRNLLYNKCMSYLNTTYDFNSEVSTDVTYNECFAGGIAGAGPSWPFTANQSLGAPGSSGFVVNGGNRVSLDSCTSVSHTTAFGAYFTALTGPCRIRGGNFSANQYGISAADLASAQNLRCSAAPIVVGNTTNNLLLPAPYNGLTGEGAGQAPAVPASTVALQNPYTFDCGVYITGGTVTVINVDGNVTGLTSGRFTVRAGGTIAITYSVVPTWMWILGD